MRTILIPAVLAALLALVATTEVQAYGAYHGGCTSYGPGGVQHTGSTTAYNPYTGQSMSHTGQTTATPSGYEHTGSTTTTGPYGGTSSYSATRTYSPSTYNSYGAVGTPPATYSNGVVRGY
jgi:hypothetical protein